MQNKRDKIKCFKRHAFKLMFFFFQINNKKTCSKFFFQLEDKVELPKIGNKSYLKTRLLNQFATLKTVIKFMNSQQRNNKQCSDTFFFICWARANSFSQFYLCFF